MLIRIIVIAVFGGTGRVTFGIVIAVAIRVSQKSKMDRLGFKVTLPFEAVYL
jgi:xanthine/uracil permease